DRTNRPLSRRGAVLTIVISLLGSLPASAASDFELISGLDMDHDGTVALDEAKKAAAILFDRIDRKRDGKLTRHELSGRLSVRELAAADTGHNGTLGKDEFMALVEQRFNAADLAHDGHLTPAELRTPAGRALMRLLK